ncbi:hypothetical protein SeLEV6574_g07094 [Synchytrium endobioticum]|uniref:F-box domain-containing protein n=1 Tax=Synchytrium endobioticum TaxID=286115 RepID=A0A507CEW3_9FUNG|nr:hypothetical protein SeLEV6574_g07094 [Synchytrium endobioticum]
MIYAVKCLLAVKRTSDRPSPSTSRLLSKLIKCKPRSGSNSRKAPLSPANQYHLPNEIWLHILSYMDKKTLGTMSQLNKHFNLATIVLLYHDLFRSGSHSNSLAKSFRSICTDRKLKQPLALMLKPVVMIALMNAYPAPGSTPFNGPCRSTSSRPMYRQPVFEAMNGLDLTDVLLACGGDDHPNSSFFESAHARSLLKKIYTRAIASSPLESISIPTRLPAPIWHATLPHTLRALALEITTTRVSTWPAIFANLPVLESLRLRLTNYSDPFVWAVNTIDPSDWLSDIGAGLHHARLKECEIYGSSHHARSIPVPLSFMTGLVAGSSTSLHTLSIYFADISDLVTTPWLSRLPHLRNLALKSHDIESTQPYRIAMHPDAALANLHLSISDYIPCSNVHAMIAQSAHTLVSLSIDGCWSRRRLFPDLHTPLLRLRDLEISAPSHSLSGLGAWLKSHGARLTTLRVHIHDDMHASESPLLDLTPAVITQHSPRLTTLQMIGYPLQHAGIIEILASLDQLESLQFGRNSVMQSDLVLSADCLLEAADQVRALKRGSRPLSFMTGLVAGSSTSLHTLSIYFADISDLVTTPGAGGCSGRQ